jgi:hypothetical protein
MGHPHPFSTIIKTGIAANSSANPAIIKIQCSQFRQSFVSKTKPNLKHNGCQTHFMGEIWQQSTTIEHELVPTAQLVWIDTHKNSFNFQILSIIWH